MFALRFAVDQNASDQKATQHEEKLNSLTGDRDVSEMAQEHGQDRESSHGIQLWFMLQQCLISFLLVRRVATLKVNAMGLLNDPQGSERTGVQVAL